MKKTLFALAAGLLLTSSLSACAPAEDVAPTKLVIAGIPQATVGDPEEGYALMIQMLEDELGIPVEFYEATDNAAITEGLAADRVDLAVMMAYGYVVAKNRTDLDLIGVTSNGADIEPINYAFAVARADDDSINSIADAKGKTVCFGDPTGSPYLFSFQAFKDAGIDSSAESADIKAVFGGTGFTPALSVAEGDCDLGLLTDAALIPAEKTGAIKAGALKRVWQSGAIPKAPIAIRSNLPQAFKDKVADLILTKANKTAFVESGVCNDVASCNFLTVTNWGFVKKTEGFLEPIREACAALGNKDCKNS